MLLQLSLHSQRRAGVVCQAAAHQHAEGMHMGGCDVLLKHGHSASEAAGGELVLQLNLHSQCICARLQCCCRSPCTANAAGWGCDAAWREQPVKTLRSGASGLEHLNWWQTQPRALSLTCNRVTSKGVLQMTPKARGRNPHTAVFCAPGVLQA